jgi:hypothetical protein
MRSGGEERGCRRRHLHDGGERATGGRPRHRPRRADGEQRGAVAVVTTTARGLQREAAAPPGGDGGGGVFRADEGHQGPRPPQPRLRPHLRGEGGGW